MIKRSLYILYFIVIGCNINNDKVNPIDNSITSPCISTPCSSTFEISKEVTPDLYIDENGYNHIQFWGPKYFTVKGELSELKEKYVINGVPLTETVFDSDYWIWLDNLTFVLPVYSIFSWYTDNEFQNPIPVGTITITLDEMVNRLPPMNISGYSINPNTCMDCPYKSNLFGTYSKYNYKPQHSFYLGPEMRGDTLQIFIKTTFNSDLGVSEENEHRLKVVVDN
jgi:hypothetical protein